MTSSLTGYVKPSLSEDSGGFLDYGLIDRHIGGTEISTSDTDQVYYAKTSTSASAPLNGVLFPVDLALVARLPTNGPKLLVTSLSSS
jgi:hypothetical protein